MITSKSITTMKEKDAQRANIVAQTALFLKKGRVEMLEGFGEKSRADLSIQGSKNRTFA